MTITLLGGYAICFINFNYMKDSSCMHTTYGRISFIDVIVFLVGASFTLLTTHVVLLLPLCASCKCACNCRRSNRGEIAP